MLQNVFQIKVDLKKKSTFVSAPEIVQNDNVRFEIEVTDNGKPLALDNVQTVSLAHSTKGETVVTSGKIEGNKVIFNLGTLETKYVGQVNATVQLYDAEGRISTIKFPYYVVADPTGKDYVPSEKEQTLIEVVMSEAQAKIDELSQVDVVDLKAKQDEFTAQLAQTRTQAIKPSTSNAAVRSNKPLVTFVDDDGNRAVLTKLMPLAEQYNIPFTLAIVSDWAVDGGNSLQINELKELQDKGFEIASHGKSHVAMNESLPKEQHFAEVYGSWKELNEHGLNVQSIVYPYGNHTSYTRQVVSRFYTSGVSTAERLETTPLQTYRLGRWTFPYPNWTLQDYKNKVDEAIANNAWLIWMLHCGQAEHNAQAQQDLEELIQYIQSKNVNIVNMSEGMEIKGNALDINEQEYYIGSDGTNNIRDLIYQKQIVATGNAPFNCDSKPSDFPKHKVTVTPITSSADVATSPENRRGTLVTYNSVDYNLVHQTFKTQRSEFYRRAESDDSWSPWFKRFLGQEIEFTENFGIIPAGGSVSKRIVITEFFLGQYVNLAPVSQIVREGLLYSFTPTNNNRINLVIFNPTSNPVELNEVTFKAMITRSG